MDASKFVSITRKYKKCPGCGSSWREPKLKVSVENEVVTISCACGFLKRVDENNKEIKGCPECGCEDGNHAQECKHYYNAGYGKKEEANKMAKVKAVLFVDEDVLRNTFKEAHPDEEYTLESALKSEMGWVESSGITLGEVEPDREEVDNG